MSSKFQVDNDSAVTDDKLYFSVQERGTFMKTLGLIGLLSTFAVITVIDMPKLKTTATKKKYMTVYYSVVAVGILLGILAVFQILPDFYKSLMPFFQKLSGVK